RAVSYAIVGVGGFLGMLKHDVAVPVSQFKEEGGKIVLPGATKEALKAAPEVEYAKGIRRHTKGRSPPLAVFDLRGLEVTWRRRRDSPCFGRERPPSAP